MTKSFKCTEDIKTTVTEDIHLEFSRLACEAGCSMAEATRDLICLRLYGITFGEHVANHRRDVLLMQVKSLVQKKANDGHENE